jgi:hypothetical protein
MIVPKEFTRKFSSDLLTKYELSAIKEGADTLLISVSNKWIPTEQRTGRSEDRIPVGARFSARPDRPWGPPSLLYNGYRVFSEGKVRPERAAEHSPTSSAKVLED